MTAWAEGQAIAIRLRGTVTLKAWTRRQHFRAGALNTPCRNPRSTPAPPAGPEGRQTACCAPARRSGPTASAALQVSDVRMSLRPKTWDSTYRLSSPSIGAGLRMRTSFAGHSPPTANVFLPAQLRIGMVFDRLEITTVSESEDRATNLYRPVPGPAGIPVGFCNSAHHIILGASRSPARK